MWTYHQQTGVLTDTNGITVGVCYSGHGDGCNNADMQHVPCVGPIPRGLWTIGVFFNDAHKGPLVCHLTPQTNTDTLKRSGFMIHGDNSKHDESASEGCIIASRFIRESIAASTDKQLQVI